MCKNSKKNTTGSMTEVRSQDGGGTEEVFHDNAKCYKSADLNIFKRPAPRENIGFFFPPCSDGGNLLGW